MKSSLLIDPKFYLDNDKIPELVNLVEKFISKDISQFCIDVGLMNKGFSINWKSVIVYDKTGEWIIDDQLTETAKELTNYAETITGIKRITINFLEKNSFMPIHIDNEEMQEYDQSSNFYNIIIPVTDHGWSIVDYKVYKNKKNNALIFNGQVPHGAMNDTVYTRISIYLLVEKNRFVNDSA